MIERRVRIGAGQASYREAGAGDAVVLVPGLGLSGRFYDRSYGAFAAAGLRLLIPDLPGSGGTGGPRSGHSVVAASEFLLELTHALGIERSVWVGHSLGAQVALRLAVEQPHLTRGVVLVGPAWAPGVWRLPRQAWSLLWEACLAPLPVVGRVLADYVRVSPLAYVGTWLRYGRDRPLERLPAVACPTLVLVGTRDPGVGPRSLARWLRQLPDARLVRVPGGSHALPRAQAEQFNTLVTRFCRSVHDAAVC